MIVFVLILAVGVIWGLLDVGVGQLMGASLNQTSNATATAHINQRQAIWDNLPFFFIAFAGIFIIARAAAQSRL
jgi:amino acid permease